MAFRSCAMGDIEKKGCLKGEIILHLVHKCKECTALGLYHGTYKKYAAKNLRAFYAIFGSGSSLKERSRIKSLVVIRTIHSLEILSILL